MVRTWNVDACFLRLGSAAWPAPLVKAHGTLHQAHVGMTVYDGLEREGRTVVVAERL